MIVLENGDVILGDATVNAEVDYSVHGLDNSALAQLADGQLPGTSGTLYAADSVDVISSIILVNTGAAHNHVNLAIRPSAGTARRLIPKDLQLEPGYSLHFDGAKMSVVNVSGQVLGVGATGSAGTSGSSSTSGTSGTAGTSGSSGSSGASGTSGTSGSSGTHGTSGTAGTSGTSGTGYPVRSVQIVAVDYTTDVSTGNGKAYFVIPNELAGMVVSRVAATMITAPGTGGSCGIALTNLGTAGTGTNAILSTNMQIIGQSISTRSSSGTGVIDTAKDDVAVGQILRVDVPNNHTTAGKGLIVEMGFSA